MHSGLLDPFRYRVKGRRGRTVWLYPSDNLKCFLQTVCIPHSDIECIRLHWQVERRVEACMYPIDIN